MLLLRFQRDSSGADGEEEHAEVCTNYRFARRSLGAAKPGRGEGRPQGDADAAEGKKAAKSKPAPVVVKGAKRGQKGAQKEEEEKPAEQAEAER